MKRAKNPATASTAAKKKSLGSKVKIDFGAPSPATARQLDFIVDIETYTGVVFGGSTMEEASRYISENIDDYREARQEDEDDNPEWYQ